MQVMGLTLGETMLCLTFKFSGPDTQVMWNRAYNPLSKYLEIEHLEITEGMRSGQGTASVYGSFHHLSELIKKLGATVVDESYPAEESEDSEVPDEVMNLLDLSVKNLRKALAANDYSAYAAVLLAAENAVKTRKGVVELLEAIIGK